MTEEKKDDPFLARWSRRKQEHAQQAPAPVAPPPAEAKPAAPLPAIEDLKTDSDFKPFMAPQVDAGTRRSALKKLFTDVHFNAVDPFEPYSIDLTGEDPIPVEMLKTLNHAKRLLFDEPEKAAEAAQVPQAPRSAQLSTPDIPQAETPLQETKDVAGKQDA